MRRIRRTLFVLLASVGLVLAVQSPAMAADNNWGTAAQFTFYPTNTQPTCGSGDLFFEYDAYRSGATQITAMWKIYAHGVMKIRLWNTYGPVSPLRSFDSYPQSGSIVYYAHFSPFPNKVSVHYDWQPNSGGDCKGYGDVVN